VGPVGDGREWLWTTGDGPAARTSGVMSHDAITVRSEVSDSHSASTGGPKGRTIVPTVRPVLTFPGVIRPSTTKETDGLDG